ncbi:MAG: winged helix-turn-helix domain-containing protein, partial [Halobacteriales archaeon]|nr:winged helix-turn-helix domain-containing protein [Halobacteriales archaeon]
MTPEELLQALLDSRSRSGVISDDHPTDSTRIRVLRALREGAGSAAELADRVDVSRQTVYRALDPCREAGLVRAVEAGSALTCSGGAVLRAYDEICEEIERTALVQLSRSAHKRWILDALEEAPARKAVLATTARQTD